MTIGDVFAGSGLDALIDRLPALRDEYQPHMVVVNAENSASGSGTSAKQADRKSVV